MARVTNPAPCQSLSLNRTTCIDYPEIFQKFGEVENRSLEFQGVDLSIGRRMGAMFRGIGLKNVNVGLLAGEWKEPSPEVFDAEWDIIAYDLGGLVPVDEILDFKAKARETWLRAGHCLYSHFLRLRDGLTPVIIRLRNRRA